MPTGAKVVWARVFWVVLYLCHLGTMPGVLMSTDWGCPSVHCPEAALVGKLRLV